MRSKLIRTRAELSAKRIGTHAVTTTLGHTKSRKLVKAIELAGASNGNRPYMVLADSQGVGYLRVENTETGAKFLVNTGHKIEVVEMAQSTIRSRNLREVPEASIAEAAKVLAVPLTKGVAISPRSKVYLDRILNDKELLEALVANKKTSTSKKAATKKSAAAANGGRSSSNTVEFLKMADEKDLPAQALEILKAVKAKSGKTVKEVVASLKIESSQPMQALWSFYRKRLIDNKYIKVATAA